MRGLTYGFDTRFPCIQERTGTARLLPHNGRLYFIALGAYCDKAL